MGRLALRFIMQSQRPPIMETKFTKGPWSIEYDERERYGTVIVSNSTVADICYRVTSEANARLIAAAPELLEALIEAREQLQGYASAAGEYYNSPMINAAIAKATGE